MTVSRDMIGNMLSVGDQVVYAKSSDDKVHFGEVAEIVNEHAIKIRRKSTGRISVNPRLGKDVLNINHLPMTFPEFMV